MEEVLPGRETSGSREQRRDQKKAIGDSLHGAHRAKEEDRVSIYYHHSDKTNVCESNTFIQLFLLAFLSKDGLNISEGTVLGGDSKDEYARLSSVLLLPVGSST